MKKLKKMLLFALSSVMVLSSCTTPTEKEAEVYKPYDYNATHESENKILKFKSSDEGLDAFLNEFFERHGRYNTATQIHNHPVGLGNTAWKEWESMIGSWWDSSNSFNQTIANGYATKDNVTNWLLQPKQDKQGYVWCDNGNGPSSWGLGWAFPDYRSSLAACCGFEFDDPALAYEGFAGVNGTALSLTDTLFPNDLSPTATGKVSKELTASASNKSEIGVETGSLTIAAFNSPFLSMGMQFINEGNTANLDDLYVYFQNAGDSGYSEEKKAKFSELCTTGFELTGNIAHDGYYIPMYLLESWGTGTRTKIQKLKVVVKAKPNKTISGKLKLDFLRCDYDDRQANNMGMYITAAANVAAYAQDADLLNHILPMARASMQHYLSILDGDKGLMTKKYYVGHDGKGVVQPGTGIGDGFWDVTSYPDISMYSNLVYYRAIEAMIYLEQLATTLNVITQPTSISGKDMLTTHTYNQSAQSLEQLRVKVKAEFEDYFWDDETGRFIAGYYGGVKAKDDIQDNGYLMFNLEAVEAGLGTEMQQKAIMSWVTGDRIIAKDDAKGADIYKYEFAPRNTTKQNVGDYVWLYNGGYFEIGVHNGGAVLQTSYYDLVARAKVLGGDNAFSRLKDIQKWFDKIRTYYNNGEDKNPWNFYRTYYDTTNISLQGGSTGGPIGLDYEFLEAALMYAAIPAGFFGIKPGADMSLSITPNMPNNLDYWKMENLTFNSHYYDLSIGKYFVELSSINNKTEASGLIAGYDVNVYLRKPGFAFRVFYENKEVSYKEENGRIKVTVPFKNGKVEIKGV